MKTMQFLVTVTLDEPTDKNTVGYHIQSAVHSWGGQYNPDDPLFPQNIKQVMVQYIQSEKTAYKSA